MLGKPATESIEQTKNPKVHGLFKHDSCAVHLSVAELAKIATTITLLCVLQSKVELEVS